jgi:hypothetical protein
MAGSKGQNVAGLAMVTDKTTRTTFSVKRGEPLADALDKAQARMGAGRRNEDLSVT